MEKRKKKYIKRKNSQKIAREVYTNRRKLVFKYNIQQLCSFYDISYQTLERNLKRYYLFNYTMYRRWRIREHIVKNHGTKPVRKICSFLSITKNTYYIYLTEKYCTGGDRKSTNWRLKGRIYFKNKQEDTE